MAEKRYFAIYFTVFLDLFGFGLILPLLPYYAVKVGASGFGVGLLFAAFSIAQFFGSPLLGRFSDRYGRRRVLLFSLAGAAIAYLLTAQAASFWALCAARAFAGFCSATIATAQAYVTDTVPAAQRTRAMGLIGASLGMGFVLGPAAGGAFSRFGFETANYLAAGMAAANLVFTYLSLPESRSLTKAARGSLTASLREVSQNSLAVRLISASFLTTLAFVAMEATLALLAAARFGWAERDMGFFFTFVGVVMAVTQAKPTSLLSARIGERRTALVGMSMIFLGLASMPYAPSIFVSGFFLAIGQALVMPTLPSLLSETATEGNAGMYLGAAQGMQSAARCVGPLIAGALYDLAPAFPYAWGSVLMIAAGIVISRRILPRRTETAEA